MSAFRVAAICLALVACAKPAVVPPPAAKPLRSETIDVEGFIAPRFVEDFELKEALPLEPREAGTQLHYGTYHVPNARIDLFVFPVFVPELFSVANVLDEMHRATLEGVKQRAAMEHGSAQLLSQRLATVPGVTPPLIGIHSQFDLSGANHPPFRSHVFVAIRGRHNLKVRFTYLTETDEVAGPAFERFLAAVVGRTAASPAGDTAQFGATATRTTMQAAHDGLCSGFVLGVGYGAGMTAALVRGEFADTFERELAARSKLLEIWAHMKQQGAGEIRPEQCVDASLDAMLEARWLGLFEEYVWRYYSKPYWIAPEGLDLAAFAAFEKRALAGHDPIRETGVVVSYAPRP